MFLCVVTRLFHCPIIIKAEKVSLIFLPYKDNISAGWVPFRFAGLLWELHEYRVIYIALYFCEVVYSLCLMSYSSTLEAI